MSLLFAFLAGVVTILSPCVLPLLPVILANSTLDGRLRPLGLIVGFAAETGDASGSVLDLGRAKLARKGCDLLVVNDVSGGAVFGSSDNEAVAINIDITPAEKVEEVYWVDPTHPHPHNH